MRNTLRQTVQDHQNDMDPNSSPVPPSFDNSDTVADSSIREPSLTTTFVNEGTSNAITTVNTHKEGPGLSTGQQPSLTPLTLTTGPPPLDYDLRTRKKSIAIFWSLILFDSIAVPVALYFGLWYGTSLSANAVFSISTACLGGVSIIEYFLRFWRLWKKGSTCRVLGAHRWYLDWFHWNFSAAWFFIMCELIIGTAFTNPPIRLLAMPVSSLCAWFAFQLIVSDTMRLLNVPCPVRISSVPKGSPMRPGIYNFIEDIVAVDGGGDRKYRDQLNARFEASHDFRQMLHRLTAFWGFGAAGIAIVTTICVFAIPNHDVSYVLGWTLPFVWAVVWVLCTFPYVKKCLIREKLNWAEHQAKV